MIELVLRLVKGAPLTHAEADGNFTALKEAIEEIEDLTEGKSAYDVAVENGFVGTEAEWLLFLEGADGEDGDPGPGLPTGGTTGQIARKASGADYDVEWHTLTTTTVAEGTNLYHTAARVLATVLTGLSTATNAVITASDTVLSALGKLQKQITDHATDTATALDLKVNLLSKDATGGYAGLTLFKINFKNAANTFTNFFTNATTAARTYTFQDRSGTIADDSDLALKEALANKATDFTTVNHTLYPTVQAAKAYADSLVAGLIDDRGSYDASSNTYPTTGGSGSAGAVLKGDLWYVSVAGTLGGSAVAIGDSFRALADTPGQTAGNWSILEANIGYVPYNATNPDGFLDAAGVRGTVLTGLSTAAGTVVTAAHTVLQAFGFLQKQVSDNTTAVATKETSSNKDATGGYAGLTLFKINFKNAANTFTNFLTNATTAARTYTFQDRSGTIADDTDLGFKEASANKDATGGYAGLTLFKINFKNAANTFTNFLTNATTAARTYTFQNRDGTIADDTDLTLKLNVAAPSSTGLFTLGGGQIKFPATQNVSSDANTLDDYERGTWTPTSAAGSVTSNEPAEYIKVGRLLMLTFDITFGATGSSSPCSLGGIPFSYAKNCSGPLAYNGYGTVLNILGGGAALNFYQVSAAQPTFANLATLRFIGTITGPA